ncbi:MAG: nuclear transport factor 2 family protein [Verrucomicrobiota bacterium]
MGAEAPVPAKAPGEVSFDANDRLAIMNLFSTLIYGWDEMDADVLLSTLAPEFTVEFVIPGSPTITVTGRDQFKEMIAKRFAKLSKDGMKRRHILGLPCFIEQKADSAHVAVGILTCTMTDTKGWHPVVSALGDFQLAKRNSVWYFVHQTEKIDNSDVDIPANQLLPAQGAK